MGGGGPACKCEERKKPEPERKWWYLDYKCNYSAFNGYRYTPSDYSLIECTGCGAIWRSKSTFNISIREGRDR